MLVDTTLDFSALDALDFEYEQPCEHSRHDDKHVPSQSAKYLIANVSPCCSAREYFICEFGWNLFGMTDVFRCNLCQNRRAMHRDELFKILLVVA